MGQKDMAEKLLEDYEDVFADIVNALLFNGNQLVDANNLISTVTKSHYKADDGKLHEQERDVAKIEKKKGINFVLYGLENQEKVDTYMPLRIFGYEGASYRSQYCKKKIKPYPVVTLVLYFGIKHVDAFLKMMTSFTHDTRYEAAIDAVKRNGGPITMCTVLDSYEQKGIQKGLIEGRQEGRQEGRKEGRKEGRQNEQIRIIKNMLSRSKTKEEIADLLALSLENVEHLIKLATN